MITEIQKNLYYRIRNIKNVRLKNHSFNKLMDSYEILFSYADYTNIAERKFLYDINDKDLKCIFCLKKLPSTTFDDKSHVISHLLGNKFLMHREECMTCNKKFGDTIETQLASFLEKFRVINGHKKRNNKTPGNLKYQAKSQKAFLQMITVDNKNILEVTGERFEEIFIEHDSETISLNFDTIYRDSDVYKALMKSIYGVIPPKYRNDFSMLRDWINNENYNVKLINSLIMYQSILPNFNPNSQLVFNVFRKKVTFMNKIFKKNNFDYFAFIGFGNVFFDIPILSDNTLVQIKRKHRNKSFIFPLLSNFITNKTGATKITLNMSSTEKRDEKFSLYFSNISN